MSSYTPEAYRAAAEIARRSTSAVGVIREDLASEWETEAKRLERLGEYGTALANKVRDRTRNEVYGVSPEALGMQLMAALLEDGWTPPEGLI